MKSVDRNEKGQCLCEGWWGEVSGFKRGKKLKEVLSKESRS